MALKGRMAPKEMSELIKLVMEVITIWESDLVLTRIYFTFRLRICVRCLPSAQSSGGDAGLSSTGSDQRGQDKVDDDEDK